VKVGKIQDLEKQVATLEAQNSLLRELLEQRGGGGLSVAGGDAVLQRQIFALTLKQQAVLQMLMNGKQNADIARRLDVRLPTAKVHVRSICLKFGVKDRASLALKLAPTWASISHDTYYRLTSLPKDWDENWNPKDQHTTRIREAYKT
jgi:DNA-binding CsgD family transcriptional regulator